MLCRHCHNRKPNRPRGLCWTCYYAPGVRDQYPIDSRFATAGVRDFNGRRPLPRRPTNALPGTPEKVKVLCERARLFQTLWHPLDATIDDATLPTVVVAVGRHPEDQRLARREPHQYRNHLFQHSRGSGI